MHAAALTCAIVVGGRVMRGPFLAASLALHLGFVGAAAVVPSRLSRVPDIIIPIELVEIAPAPPRPVEVSPSPPAPPRPKRVTLPNPSATASPKQAPVIEQPTPRPEPERAMETPEAEPVAAPGPVVMTPAVASPAPGASAPLAPGVSMIESSSSPPATSSAPVVSLQPGNGITRVARPTGGYQVRPSYPTVPRRLGIEGTTMLRVHVLDDGRIAEITVEQSAGHPDLDQAAVQSVRRWRFEPARRGEEKIPMWVRIPVEFTLR